MTVEEWWAGDDVKGMLEHLATGPSDRKWRLFACAGTRLVAHCLPAEAQPALGMTERFADDAAAEQELAEAEAAVQRVLAGPAESPASMLAWGLHKPMGGSYPLYYVMPYTAHTFLQPRLHSRYQLPALTRCIFGNPFQPVTFDARWRTQDVLGLARGIYEDRAFDRLLLLADALMDAGCGDEQIIGHCRSEGPHVRGCWVVDMVLGKE